MRKMTINVSLLMSAIAVLALTITAGAQITSVQEEGWLNSPAASSHIGNLTGDAKRAALPYRRYCVGCHGDLGDGNGEVAMWLDPTVSPGIPFRPRDFTLGVFKCRSTPTGTLPTDEDLFDTIGRGMDRSAMPIWNVLTKQERADLVAWIKHFSPRWQTEKPGAPIQIPPEPEVTADRVKAGQEVFNRVQCWKCHGVQGIGNGPSASTLQDDLGRAIVPYNFTESTRPKCGSTDQDIYKIFMTGLDGTPMPSFVDNIKPDEAWDLVFFLRTLQPHNAYNAKEKQIAKQLGLKPVNPNASAP
ncbi:MAG TPA: cytochrome c [Terriglobales bacterium]|nr:cytochrome c [Terriglobales bacterium]